MVKTENGKIDEFIDYISSLKFSRKDFLRSLAMLTGSLTFLGQIENAYAHPPSDITITFDSATKVLKAVIAHRVSNPNKHFINKVVISLAGREIIQHKISKQDNNTDQTVSYLIPDAKIGDILYVTAYCSISGKLDRAIKITP